MTLLETLRTAARKRAAYNRTRRELRAMTRETAWDLNIFREDADTIARQAVYG